MILINRRFAGKNVHKIPNISLMHRTAIKPHFLVKSSTLKKNSSLNY